VPITEGQRHFTLKTAKRHTTHTVGRYVL